jgi:hypothetical protein
MSPKKSSSPYKAEQIISENNESIQGLLQVVGQYQEPQPVPVMSPEQHTRAIENEAVPIDRVYKD